MNSRPNHGIEPEPLQQVERVFVKYRGRKLLYFSGCDYFRMASHPQVLKALQRGARDYGLNVAASRQTTGNHALYPQLESALAKFFGTDDIAFTIGSDGLSGVLAGLASRASGLVFAASDLMFGPWTIALLLGSGVFLSLRFRFVQLRHLRDAVAGLRRVDGRGALTPFQAFSTALAASIGTGNIAGVATAVVSGGPGALFWIWAYGFVATAIKFAEAVLGVRYRSLGEGRLSAGPMHYLRAGLNMPRLGWLYALVAGDLVSGLSTVVVDPPEGLQEDLRRWMGGCYQTGLSQNPVNTVKVTPVENGHPISRGCRGYVAEDEWYFDIGFRPNDPNVVPIMTSYMGVQEKYGA